MRRLLSVGCLALLSAGLVLWSTRDGATTTSDSAVYVGTARSVAAGHGLDVPFHFYPLGRLDIGTPPPGRSTPTPTPLVTYAPLAPLLLAIGGHPLGAARIEDALFLALTVLVVGLFIVDTTGELWLAAAAQAVIALSLAAMASDVGTFDAALFFAAVAILAVLRHREKPRPAWLVVAAVAIGLATLERYAAGGLIVWAALALRHQRRHALALLIMSSCPLVGWFVYEQVSGRSTGHSIGFHIVKTTVRTGIRSVADWILPANSPFALAVLGAVVVAAIVLLLARRNSTARVALLFVVVQIVVLEIAITFFDAGVNLDPDEFIPVFFAVVVAVACSVHRTRAVAIATVVLVLACGARFVVDTTTNPTAGYTTPAWVHSPIMADVRALPSNAIIYTNAPDALYLLTHRATASIPELVDYSTRKANPRFEAQLDEVRHTIATRGGFVVYVRGLDRSSFLPTEASLRRDLSLHLVRNARDGAVYTMAPVAATR